MSTIPALSPRDLFASAALPSILLDPRYSETGNEAASAYEATRYAYVIADEMLKFQGDGALRKAIEGVRLALGDRGKCPDHELAAEVNNLIQSRDNWKAAANAAEACSTADSHRLDLMQERNWTVMFDFKLGAFVVTSPSLAEPIAHGPTVREAIDRASECTP